MIDINYVDDLALLTNAPVHDESRLHSLEQAAGSIGHQVHVL